MSRELIERLEADQRAIVDDLARIQYTLDLLRCLQNCSCYETVLDSWRDFVVARLAEAGYQVKEDFIDNFEWSEDLIVSTGSVNENHCGTSKAT